jgi:cytochrome c-type biogenesis protein CcmF
MFFPNLAQALGGTRIHLSADFYGRVFAPLGLAILLLLGVCPSLGWRESSLTRLVTRLRYPILCAAVIGFMLFLLGTRQPMALFSCMLIGFAAVSVLAEPTRQTLGRIRQQRDNPFKAIVTLWKGNRRSYGGKLVHLAILLIAIGITGSSLFKSASTVTLARGNQATIKNYIVQYEGTQILDSANTRRYVASVALYKGPSPVALLQPEKNFHYSIGQYVTEVAIRSTLTEDVYIALDWPEQDGLATFRLAVYPLVSWLWIGTGLLLGGTLISLWPSSSAMKELPNEPSTA